MKDLFEILYLPGWANFKTILFKLKNYSELISTFKPTLKFILNFTF